MKVAVLGVGNILLSDEGLGVRAVEAIRERYDLSGSAELIDGGTMGLDLLPFIEGRDRLLIVDAAELGRPPGTIEIIEGDNVPKFLGMKMSVHQIGLPDMLAAARMMDILPGDICLIGMQTGSLDTGMEFSEAVKDNFSRLIDTVLAKLLEWGVPVREKVFVLPAAR